MNPTQKRQYDRALEVYENAWKLMQKHGDASLEALRKQEIVGPGSGSLYQGIAERAFVASENWRRAAQIAQEVMQEIASGIPRSTHICYLCGCDDFQPSNADPAICENGATQGVQCGHRREDHI